MRAQCTSRASASARPLTPWRSHLGPNAPSFAGQNPPELDDRISLEGPSDLTRRTECHPSPPHWPLAPDRGHKLLTDASLSVCPSSSLSSSSPSAVAFPSDSFPAPPGPSFPARSSPSSSSSSTSPHRVPVPSPDRGVHEAAPGAGAWQNRSFARRESSLEPPPRREMCGGDLSDSSSTASSLSSSERDDVLRCIRPLRLPPSLHSSDAKERPRSEEARPGGAPLGQRTPGTESVHCPYDAVPVVHASVSPSNRPPLPGSQLAPSAHLRGESFRSSPASSFGADTTQRLPGRQSLQETEDALSGLSGDRTFLARLAEARQTHAEEETKTDSSPEAQGHCFAETRDRTRRRPASSRLPTFFLAPTQSDLGHVPSSSSSSSLSSASLASSLPSRPPGCAESADAAADSLSPTPASPPADGSSLASPETIPSSALPRRATLPSLPTSSLSPSDAPGTGLGPGCAVSEVSAGPAANEGTVGDTEHLRRFQASRASVRLDRAPLEPQNSREAANAVELDPLGRGCADSPEAVSRPAEGASPLSALQQNEAFRSYSSPSSFEARQPIPQRGAASFFLQSSAVLCSQETDTAERQCLGPPPHACASSDSGQSHAEERQLVLSSSPCSSSMALSCPPAEPSFPDPSCAPSSDHANAWQECSEASLHAGAQCVPRPNLGNLFRQCADDESRWTEASEQPPTGAENGQASLPRVEEGPRAQGDLYANPTVTDTRDPTCTDPSCFTSAGSSSAEMPPQDQTFVHGSHYSLHDNERYTLNPDPANQGFPAPGEYCGNSPFPGAMHDAIGNGKAPLGSNTAPDSWGFCFGQKSPFVEAQTSDRDAPSGAASSFPGFFSETERACCEGHGGSADAPGSSVCRGPPNRDRAYPHPSPPLLPAPYGDLDPRQPFSSLPPVFPGSSSSFPAAFFHESSVPASPYPSSASASPPLPPLSSLRPLLPPGSSSPAFPRSTSAGFPFDSWGSPALSSVSGMPSDFSSSLASLPFSPFPYSLPAEAQRCGAFQPPPGSVAPPHARDCGGSGAQLGAEADSHTSEERHFLAASYSLLGASGGGDGRDGAFETHLWRQMGGHEELGSPGALRPYLCEDTCKQTPPSSYAASALYEARDPREDECAPYYTGDPFFYYPEPHQTPSLASPYPPFSPSPAAPSGLYVDMPSQAAPHPPGWPSSCEGARASTSGSSAPRSGRRKRRRSPETGSSASPPEGLDSALAYSPSCLPFAVPSAVKAAGRKRRVPASLPTQTDRSHKDFLLELLASQLEPVKGVHMDRLRKTWVASWLVGKRRITRIFSFQKFGFFGAREQAIRHRREALLNPEIEDPVRRRAVENLATASDEALQLAADALPFVVGVTYHRDGRCWVANHRKPMGKIVQRKKFEVAEWGFLGARYRAAVMMFCWNKQGRTQEPEDYDQGATEAFNCKQVRQRPGEDRDFVLSHAACSDSEPLYLLRPFDGGTCDDAMVLLAFICGSPWRKICRGQQCGDDPTLLEAAVTIQSEKPLWRTRVKAPSDEEDPRDSEAESAGVSRAFAGASQDGRASGGRKPRLRARQRTQETEEDADEEEGEEGEDGDRFRSSQETEGRRRGGGQRANWRAEGRRADDNREEGIWDGRGLGVASAVKNEEGTDSEPEGRGNASPRTRRGRNHAPTPGGNGAQWHGGEDVSGGNMQTEQEENTWRSSSLGLSASVLGLVENRRQKGAQRGDRHTQARHGDAREEREEGRSVYGGYPQTGPAPAPCGSSAASPAASTAAAFFLERQKEQVREGQNMFLLPSEHRNVTARGWAPAGGVDGFAVPQHAPPFLQNEGDFGGPTPSHTCGLSEWFTASNAYGMIPSVNLNFDADVFSAHRDSLQNCPDGAQTASYANPFPCAAPNGFHSGLHVLEIPEYPHVAHQRAFASWPKNWPVLSSPLPAACPWPTTPLGDFPATGASGAERGETQSAGDTEISVSQAQFNFYPVHRNWPISHLDALTNPFLYHANALTSRTPAPSDVPVFFPGDPSPVALPLCSPLAPPCWPADLEGAGERLHAAMTEGNGSIFRCSDASRSTSESRGSPTPPLALCHSPPVDGLSLSSFSGAAFDPKSRQFVPGSFQETNGVDERSADLCFPQAVRFSAKNTGLTRPTASEGGDRTVFGSGGKDEANHWTGSVVTGSKESGESVSISLSTSPTGHSRRCQTPCLEGYRGTPHLPEDAGNAASSPVLSALGRAPLSSFAWSYASPPCALSSTPFPISTSFSAPLGDLSSLETRAVAAACAQADPRLGDAKSDGEVGNCDEAGKPEDAAGEPVGGAKPSNGKSKKENRDTTAPCNGSGVYQRRSQREKRKFPFVEGTNGERRSARLSGAEASHHRKAETAEGAEPSVGTAGKIRPRESNASEGNEKRSPHTTSERSKIYGEAALLDKQVDALPTLLSHGSFP
ncbi:unnamed protein product [Neospora caninum Liverpool]|uniref:AP2 domain transcription factor AP2III-3 n=1 Tax=Neospora caninum (strain Liverpool) TaxID=572307 RepID=F0V9P1_NEOCL|nr:uncharacterized protein NCLIV_009360 [Neospora caninum Liverpool]CBZ50467.1 unnamed protein product [Neospora caninum Liverpool]CEL65077.1 TPA: AP2 domain transcription factor AP2III-3 [Neospora caninum Liverpool]|eukprot:XP_003880500.1 uncharacterized protein NCLIV_009360 [Neospora caninum Liverpool]